MDATLAKQVCIPAIALVGGACGLAYSKFTGKLPVLEKISLLALFLGGQTGMNLYMKAVLSHAVVVEEGTVVGRRRLEGDVGGFPAAFVVTALQQVVSFALFGLFVAASRGTAWRYTPKRIGSGREWLAVLLFSSSFAVNVALNNFSLSLVPLSVNLMIRGCMSLSTFLSQQVFDRCMHKAPKSVSATEVLLMLAGTAFAVVAVVARTQADAAANTAEEADRLTLGIIVCVASLFSGSLNLALAAVLGMDLSLNALDTTVYMSLPATLMLLPPILFYAHPVGGGWGQLFEGGVATDRDMLAATWQHGHSVLWLAALSGIFALGFNVVKYSTVQSLSPTHTAFAGNFNKAATIALGVFVGLESLPGDIWGWGGVFMLATVGNIAAFTWYNLVTIQAKAAADKGEAAFEPLDPGAEVEGNDVAPAVQRTTALPQAPAPTKAQGA